MATSAHTTLLSTSYSIPRVPLSVILYLSVFTLKAILWMQSTPEHMNWWALLVINVLESIAWTVWMFRRHGKQLTFLFLPLPLICSVYLMISVALLAAGFGLVYPFPDSAVYQGMFMQSVMNTHLWFFTGIFFSRKSGLALQQRTLNWLDSLAPSSTALMAFAVLGLVAGASYLINFYVSGASALMSQDPGQRGEIIDILQSGKNWLITAAFVAWLVVWSLLLLSARARRAMKLPYFVVSILAMLLFFTAYFRLGNRREMVTALFLVTLLLLMKGRTRLVMVILAVGLFMAVNAAIVRSLIPDAQGGSTGTAMDNIYAAEGLFSEAIFPNYPLLDSLSSHHDLLWGTSYLRLPGYIIPSFGLWEKPHALAADFSKDFANGAMGFGYTPLGEGYANFGESAVLLTPLLLVLGEWGLLQLALGSRRAPMRLLLILFFMSTSMDIIRGEFITHIGNVVLYSALCWCFLRVSQSSIWRLQSKSR